jgi:hypothetical protein
METDLLKGIAVNLGEAHKTLFQSFQEKVYTTVLPRNVLASELLIPVSSPAEKGIAKFINPISEQRSFQSLKSQLTGAIPSSFEAITKGSKFNTTGVFDFAKLHDFLPSTKAVMTSVLSLEKVWPQTSIASVSIEGMAGLMSLKNAISQSPFSDASNLAVKTLIGVLLQALPAKEGMKQWWWTPSWE